MRLSVGGTEVATYVVEPDLDIRLGPSAGSAQRPQETGDEAEQALRRRISVLVADGVLGAEDTAGLVEDGP